MQMLYNSESFAVVQIVLAAPEAPQLAGEAEQPALLRGGFEIVDKTARREIFIEGALAERFQRGVQALVDTGANTEEAFDAYIADFAGMAQQPLVLH